MRALLTALSLIALFGFAVGDVNAWAVLCLVVLGVGSYQLHQGLERNYAR